VNSEFPGFIATGCHHPAIGTASDNHRFPDQGRVLEELYGYKKCILINMNNVRVF
jgi:hypothetical protein